MPYEKASGILFVLKKINSPWPYLKFVQGHLLSKVLFTVSVCTVGLRTAVKYYVEVVVSPVPVLW